MKNKLISLVTFRNILFIMGIVFSLAIASNKEISVHERSNGSRNSSGSNNYTENMSKNIFGNNDVTIALGIIAASCFLGAAIVHLKENK